MFEVLRAEGKRVVMAVLESVGSDVSDVSDVSGLDGERLEAQICAIEHLSDAACRSNAPAGAPRPSRVEALVELARTYLDGASVAPKVERRHLVMLVDVSEVTRAGDLGIDGDGRCALNGQRITPETAARIGLSGPITTILMDHRGLPLSVGRTHHTIEWEAGGLTDLLNLLLLCPFHHHRVHEHGITITLDPYTAAVGFHGPDGAPVTTRTLDPDHAPPRPEIPDGTLRPGEAGTRLELHDITQNLHHRDHRDDRAA